MQPVLLDDSPLRDAITGLRYNTKIIKCNRFFHTTLTPMRDAISGLRYNTKIIKCNRLFHTTLTPMRDAITAMHITTKIDTGVSILTPIFAVRAGFEPAVQNYPYAGLANRWFQPLTHLTGTAIKNIKNTFNMSLELLKRVQS